MTSKQLDFLKILIATKSSTKIKAIEKAFTKYWSKECLYFIPIETSSSVPCQPFEKETIQGAESRLENAFKERNQHYLKGFDYSVSIENGLFWNDKEQQYYDKGYIILCNERGEKITSFTEGVLFPKEEVEESLAMFQIKTVGELLQEKGKVKNKNNPHLELYPFKSRDVLLSETLIKMLKQIY